MEKTRQTLEILFAGQNDAYFFDVVGSDQFTALLYSNMRSLTENEQNEQKNTIPFVRTVYDNAHQIGEKNSIREISYTH